MYGRFHFTRGNLFLFLFGEGTQANFPNRGLQSSVAVQQHLTVMPVRSPVGSPECTFFFPRGRIVSGVLKDDKCLSKM